MKPKSNHAGDATQSLTIDRCYTPAYAIDPIKPFIPPGTVWEPAAGGGHIVNALQPRAVVGTDINGAFDHLNFFDSTPDCDFSSIVTNPPYSIKYAWMERCYEIGEPFALLLPVETIGAQKAQRLMKRYGCEIMLLDKRVDFYMPNKGWNSSAQFPVLWFCWHMLPEPIMYGTLNKKQP